MLRISVLLRERLAVWPDEGVLAADEFEIT